MASTASQSGLATRVPSAISPTPATPSISVGAGPGRPGAGEVREQQQRERSERGERRDLRVADQLRADGEVERDDDGRADRGPHGRPARVLGAQPPPQSPEHRSVHLGTPVGGQPVGRPGHGLVDRVVLRVGELRAVVVVLRSRSPRTRPRRARSCARSGGRSRPRARWRAGPARSRNNRCARTARSGAGAPTSRRRRRTRRSPSRSAVRPDRCPRRWSYQGLLARVDRQAHPEARVAGHRLHRQVAVVLLDHDPPGDVQPEAGALPDRLGGEERFEDAPDDVVRDARDRCRRRPPRRCSRRRARGADGQRAVRRPSPATRCRSGSSTPGSVRRRRPGSRAATGRSP